MSAKNDRIRIEISIDRKSAHRILIVGGALILLASAGAVFAVPLTFRDGDTLKAADLNQNFGDLETRVASLEAFKSHATQSGKYSLGARFCGATGNTKGDLSGLAAAGSSYAKAKAACESATGCSPSAHVCTADETYRSLSTGVTPPDGWIMDTVSSLAPGAGSFNITGCDGFTNASNTRSGMIWIGELGIISGNECSAPPAPLLCCD